MRVLEKPRTMWGDGGADHRLGIASSLGLGKGEFKLVPLVIVLSLVKAGFMVVVSGSTERPSMEELS